MDKRAFSIWYKIADWPKNTTHRYIWAENEAAARKIGAKVLKTRRSNVQVLEKPYDFVTPYTYPN